MPKKETKPKKESKRTVVKSAKRTVIKPFTSSKMISVKSTPEVKMQAVNTSPKDVFLHLLMLVMLYLSVFSLIGLCFAYVDYSFPDVLNNYRTGFLDSIRFHSAMLVVSFPLLLILAHFVQKEFRLLPKKHELRFYKWLTYLTLFVSAITIVIDLIQLVNRFYSGELTTPFLLKVMAVLIVAGAVFGYYIWDVQSESYKSKIPRQVAWTSSVVILAMLILGFVLVGSPSQQRKIRMDEERVNNLSYIQSEIIYYWQQKESLPESLTVLNNDLRAVKIPNDPQTGEAYEYAVIDKLSFELCADFNLENRAQAPDPYAHESMAYEYSYSRGDSWTHKAGRECFRRTIDPELYPKETRL